LIVTTEENDLSPKSAGQWFLLIAMLMGAGIFLARVEASARDAREAAMEAQSQVDNLEQRVERRLDRIEEKLDQALTIRRGDGGSK
jgi:hypothetical protein